MVYLGSTLDAWHTDGWRVAASFLLGGVGFVVTAFVRRASEWRTFEDPADAKRLDVVAALAFAAFAAAWAVQLIWGPGTPGLPPVALSLACVGGCMLAAEALVILGRGQRRVTT